MGVCVFVYVPFIYSRITCYRSCCYYRFFVVVVIIVNAVTLCCAVALSKNLINRGCGKHTDGCITRTQ